MSSSSADAELAAAQVRAFTREGFVLLAIATTITILRTYARWDRVGFKKFRADDYLVWLALALYSGETINYSTLVADYRLLSNDSMTDAERAGLGSNSEEYRSRVGGSKSQLAAWPLYALLLWSLKAAIGVFYLRLTEGLNGYRNRIYAGFGLIGVTFLVVMLVPFLTCLPTTKMWQVYPDPGPLCYPSSSPVIFSTFLACDIFTNIYLIWIPMPILFTSTLSKTAKTAMLFLLGCGLCATAAAFLKVTYIATEVPDARASMFWTIRESFIATTTTNLASMAGMFRRWLSSSWDFVSIGGRSGTRTRRPRPRSLKELRDACLFTGDTRRRSQGPKTEIYSVRRMSVYSTTAGVTAGRSSLDHIVDLSGDDNGRGAGNSGLFGARMGHLSRKVSMKRVSSVRSTRPGTAKTTDESEGGIQKQVEITITEEKRPTTAQSDTKTSRRRCSFNTLDNIEIEAGIRWSDVPELPNRAFLK